MKRIKQWMLEQLRQRNLRRWKKQLNLLLRQGRQMTRALWLVRTSPEMTEPKQMLKERNLPPIPGRQLLTVEGMYRKLNRDQLALMTQLMEDHQLLLLRLDRLTQEQKDR